MNTNTCMYGSSLRICIVQMYCIFIWDGSLQFNLSMMFDYTKAHSSKYCFSMFVVRWYYNRKLFSISNSKRSRILSANLTALMILLHLMHNSACSKIQLNSQIHNVRGEHNVMYVFYLHQSIHYWVDHKGRVALDT